MASSNECAETTRVLLVDPQSLPVLLQGDSEENAADISVDLLQQALQGTSAIDEADDGEPAGEVSLGTLAGDNSDVVAIYQGEEGQTHTIKISLAEAQSLGLQFSTDNFPVSLSNGSLVDGMKVTTVGDQLGNDDSGTLSSASLLQSVACSTAGTEGRMIDEEGNIVEAAEALQILPPSLSSFLDDGINQSLSIVPQYELDGTVTYAVKLKDQNDTVLGTDYHVLEPDSSAKTGLDIEEELKNSNLKHNILHSAGTITAQSLGLTSSVALTSNSNVATPAGTIQVPISTLEAFSKQILLPVSSASIPMSVTLSIPTETAVQSNTASTSSHGNLTSANASRYFQIVTNRNAVGLNSLISAEAASLPLGTIVSQPTLTGNQQHHQLISPSATMINLQNTSAESILNNRSINHASSRQQIINEKFPSILASPKGMPGTSLKTVTALRKLPIPAISPAPVMSNTVQSPAMAAVAPSSFHQNLSNPTVIKSAALTNGRLSSSHSNSSKPLGSSENPIQLVQQGQTFHSMQALNQAQLRQIATVLQQKHLNTNSTATKNVLFDEQTKTRIVYRVVYPEDVDLQQPSSPSERVANSVSQSSKTTNRLKGKPGRPKNKRKAKKPVLEKPSSRIEPAPPHDMLSPLLTDTKKGDLREENGPQEEPPKAEKKKILGSRTRSGRVSRPPKHMMTDFKRLHHLDYNEKEIDDSDDGYSDYSNPEQPPEKPPVKEIEIDVSPVKRKVSRFTCPTCKKLYLGVGRMEKHFLQHPDHGSFEEFKEKLSASLPTNETNGPGDKDMKPSTSKVNLIKGRKRNQGFAQSEKDRSELRKKKLKQALQACEISEVLEVAGPLIARYYSLWDLLLLRLAAKDDSCGNKENVENSQKPENTTSTLQELSSSSETNDNFVADNTHEKSQRVRSTANRVQWLLMELNSLAETLKSLAGDLFQPVVMQGDERAQVEISQKPVSEMFGVSCGMYSVNEEQLFNKFELFTAGTKQKLCEDPDVPPEKRSRKLDDTEDLGLVLNHTDPEMCSESLSSLSLMVKPVDNDNDNDKSMLAKLTEDMPFLNSSDDMICGTDPDLSVDSKRDQDCDSATGLQVVDDIVNERLKNLSDNINFSVPLQGALETSEMSGEQSDLHLISSFGGTDASISVSSSSVISSSLADNSKASDNVSNMDLISSYSMSSLSRPGAHDVNISNSEPPNDLASALEPVTSQSMLGGFGMGLSALSSFDPLQSQSSNVSHSEDSFLESLSSFETPLTQSCSSSNTPGPSFEDGVMKSDSMLALPNESTESSRLPPKFISSFTPAITNDKSSSSISTAQRLQRSYLELDSGLDDGLDLDFEAFTQELNLNRNNNA